MRKLTLLMAAGTLWLFLAAVPAFADGGPHVSSLNSGNGVTGLTSDTCAECHRAHTASGPMLLTEKSEEDLCLACHGAAVTGATTDVMTGVQYALATSANTSSWAATTAYPAGRLVEPTTATGHYYMVTVAGTSAATEPTWPTNGSTVIDGTVTWKDQGVLPARDLGTKLGALRGGGFDQARIDSGNVQRALYLRSATENSARPKVGVLATPEDVTSAHISILNADVSDPAFGTGNNLSLPHVAWGNGAAGTGAGPTATVGCASCHNPHGNGQYRILNLMKPSTDTPIDETWTVKVVNSNPADEFIYTETAHALMNDDQVTLAGATGVTPGTYFVVSAGAAGANTAGVSLRFKVATTKGGTPVDITAAGTGGTVSRISGVPVSDATTAPAADDARNYTIMEVKGTEGTDTSYLLLQSQITQAIANGNTFGTAVTANGNFGPLGGDYFRRNVPWNPMLSNATCNPLVSAGSDNAANQAACATANSAPNGKPSTFTYQITAWCATCHSRYFADRNATAATPFPPASGKAYAEPRPGDSLFEYQHSTTPGRDCLTCHVSHGSNATMAGEAKQLYPGQTSGIPTADSRLLKVDNRGTCQSCHEPTGTLPAGNELPAGHAPWTLP